MSIRMHLAVVAATIVSAAIPAAHAETSAARALAFAVQSGDIHKPFNGINYTVGSDSVLGFFEATDGKCVFTLMFSKRRDAQADTADKSAVLVHVIVSPGEDTRIGSIEGETLQLTCNAGARTVSAVQRSSAEKL